MQCIGCCFGIYKFQETRHMSRQFLKYAHLNALIDVFLVFVRCKKNRYMHHAMYWMLHRLQFHSKKPIEPKLYPNEHMIVLNALRREMTGLLVADSWIRYMHHGMVYSNTVLSSTPFLIVGMNCYALGLHNSPTSLRSIPYSIGHRTCMTFVWVNLCKSLWSVYWRIVETLVVTIRE